MNSTYIDYISKIDYPDYAKKKKAINSKKVDLTLLDLSLNDSELVNNRIKRLMTVSAKYIGKYVPTQDERIKESMFRLFGFDKENTLITAGCDGALRVLSQLLIEENTNVLIPVPSFGRYEYHTKVNKGKLYYQLNHEFPYAINVESLIKRSKKTNADVIFLASPNNPTGLSITESELRNLLTKTKATIILDESLITDPSKGFYRLVTEFPQLIVCGSFSKIYGLAGLRVGYIFATKEYINALSKLVSPFEVSSLSLEIANETINDDMWIKARRKSIENSIRELQKIGASKKFKVTNTETLTAMIKYSGKRDLHKILAKRAIKTIKNTDFRGLENENSVRVSLKDKESVIKLVEVLETI